MSIEKLDLQTPDMVNANFEKLGELFPNCVTETANGKAIDFDMLKQELSHAVIEGNKERYRLEWPGKREAIVTANLPTTNTLRPIREDSVDFDNTENLYIEGDNLEVLKLLQESYLGKIKMIYIDPPYNTGKDFVYKDNFTGDKEEHKLESGFTDEYNNRLIANPDTSGRYHSDWLSMMYPRLKLARNLLTDDGVIFISIDDNEVHNLRKIGDEIFGEQNFVAELVWEKKKKASFLSNQISNVKEYILVYSKNINFSPSLIGEVKTEVETYPCINPQNKRALRIFRKGMPSKYKEKNFTLEKNSRISISTMDIVYKTPLVIKNGYLEFDVEVEGNWRYTQESLDGFYLNHNLYFTQDLYIRRIVDDERNKTLKDLLSRVGDDDENDSYKSFKINNLFADGWGSNEDGAQELRDIFDNKVLLDYPKPKKLLIKLIASLRENNDFIILDFFSGSATTAHAVMQLNAEDNGNRKFIMVQVPETTDEKSEAFKAGYKNICEIGKERIRRAGKKIKEEYDIRIASEKSKKENQLDFENQENQENQINHSSDNYNLDIGFRVFRLDTSNMQDVYYKPQDYTQENLQLFADNVKPDRTADDLLAQIMLDWGLSLSLKIEQITIAGKQVFQVAEDSLLACFDNGIDENFAKEIAKLKALRVVFKDASFKDDTAKENVKQLLKQLSPNTEMKVI